MRTEDAQPEDTAEPSTEDVARCLAVLHAVERLPVEHPIRACIEEAASRLHRRAKKRLRKQREARLRDADQAVLEQLSQARQEVAGVRSLTSSEPEARQLLGRRPCYVCKQSYSRLHPLYLSLCPECARENEARRVQRVELTGRRALVTGGRVKVGFHLALKLLRDGARVLVTSRYPRDAARRYAQEPDFESWRHRLVIHGLDLRDLSGVRDFCAHLLATEPHLDILVNNAAQTLRPAPEHDTALARLEASLARGLPAPALALLGPVPGQEGPWAALPSGAPRVEADVPGLLVERRDGGLVDARARNSWVLRLEEVEPVELVEVQLVNAIAPFLLNGQLKPLLLRSPFPDRHIVNVSAVEGQFQREHKTVFHPHTNMAKAALNMMTRTSAAGYAREGIYMNSVDTGWLTNENPEDKRSRMAARGFETPLDCVDGAARVYDPIVQGVRGRPVHGLFLKDYRSAPW